MTDKILASIDKENLQPGKKLAVLINNLGAVPRNEMAILAKDVFEALPEKVDKWLIGPAALMTSLDMNGFSVTLLPVNDPELLKYLLASCGSNTAWPFVPGPPCLPQSEISYPKDPLAYLESETSEPSKQDEEKNKIIREVCELLLSKEQELNAIDSKVGDGDCGKQMALGAKGVLSALEKGSIGTGEDSSMSKATLELSKILAREMGGSSGILLSIMFSSMSKSLQDDPSLVNALNAGVKAMSEYGGAQKGDRTMLDALIPACESGLANSTVDG